MPIYGKYSFNCFKADENATDMRILTRREGLFVFTPTLRMFFKTPLNMYLKKYKKGNNYDTLENCLNCPKVILYIESKIRLSLTYFLY